MDIEIPALFLRSKCFDEKEKRTDHVYRRGVLELGFEMLLLSTTVRSLPTNTTPHIESGDNEEEGRRR